MAIGVVATGSFVPERIVTNSEIAAWTGAPETWISERTGVIERRYADEGTATSDLAYPAAVQALRTAELDGTDLSALVVATCTPDVPQPATAAILQHKLGLKGVPSFDVNAVCSGFLYGVILGEALLRSRGSTQPALVVGADMFSRIVDRGDRKTVSLFGDGAGAVVLAEVPDGYGIIASRWLTDGEFHHYLGVDAGGTRAPLTAERLAAGEQYFHLNGRPTRDYFMATLRKILTETLSDCHLAIDDVDRFIFHQGNPRMLEDFVRSEGLDSAKVEVTGTRYGNTSSASVPLTLHESHLRRPLQRGERIVLAAVGGGLTAGAAVLVWH